MIKITLRYTIIIFFTALVSCDKKNQIDSAKVDKEKKTNEIILTQEQCNAVGIKVGTVENKNLNYVIKVNGYTVVTPEGMADVSSLIDGVVKDIYVSEGSYVKKGQTLVTLQNLEIIEIQENYNTAIANIEYLQSEYNRQKILTEENINAQKIFQEIKSKLNAEKVRAQAAKERLTELGLGTELKNPIVPIRAPISGYVIKLNVNKGSYADLGKPLVQIIDNKQMFVDLNVYEKDVFKVYENQKVDFVFVNQPEEVFKGHVLWVNKSFSNRASKTVTVRVKFDSSQYHNLIPKMYVSANINLNNILVTCLPSESIVKNDGKFFVFLQEERNKNVKNKELHFKPLEVVPGITDLGYTEVKFINPIPANAKIVTKGTFYILSIIKGISSE